MRTTAHVLDAIERERDRQDAKWGVQNHPSMSCTVIPTDPRAARDASWRFGLPTASEARESCDDAKAVKDLCWPDILVEEVAESIEEAARNDWPKLRAELIQVAAVCVAWIECMDRSADTEDGA